MSNQSISSDFAMKMESDVVDATREQKDSIKGVTSFVGLFYSVTEFYVFTARLSLALGIKIRPNPEHIA